MTQPSDQTRVEPTGTATPWAVQEPAAGDRATPRARRYVENLPDWEPLPPGEILVQRRHR